MVQRFYIIRPISEYYSYSQSNHGLIQMMLIFCLILVKQSKRSINSLQDLVKQDKIKYGVLNSGAMNDFFEGSQVTLYRQMFSQMRQQNSFVSSTKEGVAKARAGGYAYLTEQPYLDYYNQRKPCNTMLLNNLLTAKSYGFGLQRNSQYVNALSVAILNVGIN